MRQYEIINVIISIKTFIIAPQYNIYYNIVIDQPVQHILVNIHNFLSLSQNVTTDCKH